MYNFSLKNIDNRFISLSDYLDTKGFIIVFTCNHCPYAIPYERRLVSLNNELSAIGFPLIAICANDPIKYPLDSFENMQKRAEEKGFNFPYLWDETQEVAKAYGAERTPHAFVLVKKSDGSLRLSYQGAIDDNYKEPSLVKNRYVAAHVHSLINDPHTAFQSTPAIGCTIKWK